jgi:hypothetical protein
MNQMGAINCYGGTLIAGDSTSLGELNRAVEQFWILVLSGSMIVLIFIAFIIHN